MLRSTFFAIGTFVFLCGISFLFVDKMVLKMTEEPIRQQGFRGMFAQNQQTAAQGKVLDPPDWAAFSLLSIGSVTMLYSVALPKKKAAG
jgi:hypothetical protein